MKQRDEQMEICLKRLLEDRLEEKRGAGLDMLLRLSRDETRKELYQKVKPFALTVSQPTDKERILIQEIMGENQENAADRKGCGIYDPDAPEKQLGAAAPARQTLMKESGGEKEWRQAILPMSETEVLEKIHRLDCLVKQYKDYEYDAGTGDAVLLGNRYLSLKGHEGYGENSFRLDNYPLAEVFREFYEKELGDYRRFVEFEARLLLNNGEAYQNGAVFYQAVFGRCPFKPLPMSLDYVRYP